jgi:hypothetical protein
MASYPIPIPGQEDEEEGESHRHEQARRGHSIYRGHRIHDFPSWSYLALRVWPSVFSFRGIAQSISQAPTRRKSHDVGPNAGTIALDRLDGPRQALATTR